MDGVRMLEDWENGLERGALDLFGINFFRLSSFRTLSLDPLSQGNMGDRKGLLLGLINELDI